MNDPENETGAWGEFELMTAYNVGAICRHFGCTPSVAVWEIENDAGNLIHDILMLSSFEAARGKYHDHDSERGPIDTSSDLMLDLAKRFDFEDDFGVERVEAEYTRIEVADELHGPATAIDTEIARRLGGGDMTPDEIEALALTLPDLIDPDEVLRKVREGGGDDPRVLRFDPTMAGPHYPAEHQGGDEAPA